jgi:hypothetical protein
MIEVVEPKEEEEDDDENCSPFVATERRPGLQNLFVALYIQKTLSEVFRHQNISGLLRHLSLQNRDVVCRVVLCALNNTFTCLLVSKFPHRKTFQDFTSISSLDVSLLAQPYSPHCCQHGVKYMETNSFSFRQIQRNRNSHTMK